MTPTTADPTDPSDDIHIPRQDVPTGDDELATRARMKAELGLYDDADLAALLGVSEATVLRHRVNKTGPIPTRVMRAVYYRRQDVADWIAQNRDVTDLPPKGKAPAKPKVQA